MRTIFTIAFLISLLGLTGCTRFTSSGIPATLDSDTPILKAGHAQGIRLTLGSNGESAHFTSFETERRFYATVTSGTGGQLMAAYRQEVERIITGTGAQIYETGITGTTNDVHDFSYGYTWRGTDGIVRAFSFTGTNSQVQVVIVCYEHTK
jgi:hypothetical protein